ncbi:MAG: hypothetical protein BWK80_28185 [Desulfobacteraceae bacterium IS3]|nr:MAG: hypothetical protein BWK80_28185 [Desulfobacteraceae bacterium IS3]
MDIHQLESLVRQYQEAAPEAMQGMEPVLQAERKALAEFFLNCPEHSVRSLYEGAEGKRFHLLRQADLQDLPRDAEADGLAVRILEKWHREKTPGTLIAAMLMLQPRELPLPAHLSEITDWLVSGYADFLLSSPGLFSRIGEADQFANFFAAMVDLLHRSLVSEETFPQAEAVRNLFVQKANFIQFYFNEKNLRRTYRQRAEIMESWALQQKAPLSHLFPLRHARDPQAKLKVGILSAHFTPQTEIYLMLSYFDKIPKEMCHLTLYSMRRTEHPLEEYCRSRADNFVLLPEGAYPQKADRIRADDLDVLLIGTNTSAVTNPIAIMAMFRMARIHVIVENSPVSTGFTHTDYYLSSMFNEPDDDAQKHYTERLYRVPGMLNYYSYHKDTDPRTISIHRTQLGIPENATVYFSGANFFKILPDLSNVWSWIFNQVPNSYLILMPFNPNWTKRYLAIPFINRIKAQMEQAGVDFSKRVRILNRVPTRADVHAVMELCDIYLDSFPYAGACSLIDPLLVGLPIVCRESRTMRGSLAAAMLRGAGLEELIVSDAGEYVERAVALGSNPEFRERTRRHIRDTLSRYNPFFDTAACGVKTAAAFADMADRQRRAETYLLAQTPERLKTMIQEHCAELRNGNPFFRNLADAELVRLLLIPYFQSLPPENKPEMPYLIDLSAGYGHFAVPFINIGWRADLFEAQQDCQTHLNSFMKQVPGRVRVLPKFEIPHDVNKIVMLRSGDAGIADFLSQDFFRRFSPKMMMLPAVCRSQVAGLEAQGYDSIFFSYGDADVQVKQHRLTEIVFAHKQNKRYGEGKGVFIFYRKDDTIFLVTLLRLSENFLPASEKMAER